MTKGPLEQYVHFIYWSYQVSSAGAYGDVWAVTNLEKMVQVFFMCFFRLVVAFISAEVTNIFQYYQSIFEESLARVNDVYCSLIISS